MCSNGGSRLVARALLASSARETAMEEKLKGKNPEEVFKEIYAKCKASGISPLQLAKLSSVQRLRVKKKRLPKHFGQVCWAVFVVFLGIVGFFRLHTVAGFTKVWFYFHGLDLENEYCTIEVTPEFQNFFMPPVDCSMCSNLTQVEKVSRISPEEFEKRYAYSGVPVVISDGTINWTAPEVFSFDFFKSLYLDEDKKLNEIEDRECQFFPYQTKFVSLVDVLSMNPDRARMKRGSKPWYIGWSNCDTNVGNILRKHYRRPYFLPLLAESVNVDWIFMGTPGYGAHMHIDHVDNPSWQAQIKGKKLWTLEPVPECYEVCKTLDVLVEAGEVIVLDTNRWYHKTLIVGKELSITIGSEYD